MSEKHVIRITLADNISKVLINDKVEAEVQAAPLPGPLKHNRLETGPLSVSTSALMSGAMATQIAAPVAMPTPEPTVPMPPAVPLVPVPNIPELSDSEEYDEEEIIIID